MNQEKILNLIKEFFPYVLTILVVILIRTFLVTPVRVNGTSMVPTLDHNEILLLKKYDHNYERFEIVVFNYERIISYTNQQTKKERLVKRIVGFPSEHIRYQDNKLYVNGTLVEENFINTTTNDFDLTELGYKVIPEGYYFVMGDNRNNSTDSRVIGLIKQEDIIGTTNFALFPFEKFGKID